MATTVTQDADFIKSMFNANMLEDAISWITSNMSIEEVFGEDTLFKEAANYDPETIFNKNTLETWAEDNGYTKE